MNKKHPIPNHKVIVNCKEATQLMVIQEFEKLNIFQRLALGYHLLICKACRYFYKQSASLNDYLRKNEMEQNLSLSFEKKEEISRMLNDLN